MTDREIERILEEGRRALAEKRNAELRARIAARRGGQLRVLQYTCGLDFAEPQPKQNERKYAVFH